MDKWLWIQACDTLFFRDSRPFLGGGSNLARSLYPPTPHTIQGALRSAVLAASGVSWEAYRAQGVGSETLIAQIGHPALCGAASLGELSLRGLFVGRMEAGHVTPYVPLPADVRRTKAGSPEYFSLRPRRIVEGSVVWPAGRKLFPLWPPVMGATETPEDPYLLSQQALRAYLDGRSFCPRPRREFVEGELRTGIAIDYDRRSPKESMLYQVEMARPEKDVGFVMGLSGLPDLPDEGLLRLGGEGRGAHYHELCAIECGTFEALSLLAQPTCQFKVVLLTPAWFSGGWEPGDGDEGWSTLFGQPTKLIAAALGRPEPIGGWDLMAGGGHGWHKPLRAHAPAGSVYLFETTEPIRQIPACLTQTPKKEPPYDRLGFGQVAAGSWDWIQSKGDQDVS
jgi:CRISPR-associated protein Cmr3